MPPSFVLLLSIIYVLMFHPFPPFHTVLGSMESHPLPLLIYSPLLLLILSLTIHLTRHLESSREREDGRRRGRGRRREEGRNMERPRQKKRRRRGGGESLSFPIPPFPSSPPFES